MKRTISVLLSLCILLSMLCVFYVPAEATSVYHIYQPHTEIYFGGFNSPPLPFVFTVPDSGLYLIQTLGYVEGEDGNLSPNGQINEMVLLDSGGGGYTPNGLGYENNMLLHCMLEWDQQYTLVMNFSEDTQFCRLEITRVEEHFTYDQYFITYYSDIESKDVNNEPGIDSAYYQPLEFTFTSNNIDKAQVYLVNNDNSVAYGNTQFEVEVDCAYEVNVLLLDPRAIGSMSIDGLTPEFDLSDGGPALLDFDVPYLLIVYFDRIDAEEILDYEIDVTITFN